jgi:glycosyltransferase involved in cell wall biosynthesis
LRDNIKISIVTVVCNGEEYLEQTIKSVLNQSYENVEYIIIDGGSIDKTVDIIKKYESEIAYWVSEDDNGIYDAMNKGVLKATGDIIGIINADDYYEIDIFNSIVDCYISRNFPDIIYADMVLMNEVTKQRRTIQPSLNGLVGSMTLNHPACFVSRKLYDEKLFDRNYKICADYDLMVFFKTKNKKFQYLNKTAAYMRMGGASDNFKLSTKEVFHVQLKYYGIVVALFNSGIRKLKRFLKYLIKYFLDDSSIEKLRGFK